MARRARMFIGSLCTVAVMLIGSVAFALSPDSVTWSISGPGTTAVSTANGCMDASYKYTMPSWSWDFSNKYWYVTATAPASENFTFDYKYWAFHSWFMAQAQLDVFANGPNGQQSITLVNSYGQGTWTGTSSIAVHQGYTFGFRIRGYNFDSSRIWDGTLNVCGKTTDSTPPVITPTVTGTQGSNGWYTSNVNVSWSVTDPESAVTSTSGCGPVTISADTAGTTLTCTATSAGGTASQSVTITRDATPPTVTYSGNAGSYTVDQMVDITCTAADNLSGVASTTCANISGPAYNFNIGANQFSATATDNAGNQGSGSTSFTVQVTYDSLMNLTARFVSQQGILNSLSAKLRAAKAAAARGDATAKAGQLGAFVNEVSAQTGKALSADQAALLLRLVAYL